MLWDSDLTIIATDYVYASVSLNGEQPPFDGNTMFGHL